MGTAAAALTLWLVAGAGMAAAATLPVAAFLVRSSGWSFIDGEVPADEVLDVNTDQTECTCKSFCLSEPACLSWFYQTEGQTCTRLKVRGNRESLRPGPGAGVLYRQGLAYLGDWCQHDDECTFLTSGMATCQDNNCSCADGLSQMNRTTCGTTSPSTEAPETTSETPPATTAAAAAGPTGLCSGTSQYELHETDCGKYYQCANGTPVVQTCAGDLVWDQEGLKCDRKANVPRCSAPDT